MSTTLQLLRAQNAILGRVAPKYTAARAKELFTRPRSRDLRPWELEVEAEAQRLRLREGWSALRWPADGPRVLCIHGWEGRATQFGVMATRLNELGVEVVALDGPAHGRSPGEVAHPIAFARALMSADRELGGFHAVIGHSMGAGATGIALSWGLRAQRAVYLAGPSSLRGVANRFADFVGLPTPAQHEFLDELRREVGFEAEEIDVAHLVRGLDVPGLIVHDIDDEAIPVQDGRAVAAAWPDAHYLELEGVGHHKVLRDPEVVERVAIFAASGIERSEAC